MVILISIGNLLACHSQPTPTCGFTWPKGIFITIHKPTQENGLNYEAERIHILSADSLDVIIKKYQHEIRELSFWQIAVPNSNLYSDLNTLNKLVLFNVAEIPKTLGLKSKAIIYIRTLHPDKNSNKSFYPSLYHLLSISKQHTKKLVLAGVDKLNMKKIPLDSLKSLEVEGRVKWGNQNKILNIKTLDLHVNLDNPHPILFRLKDPERIVLHDLKFQGLLPAWLSSYEHICKVRLHSGKDVTSQLYDARRAICPNNKND